MVYWWCLGNLCRTLWEAQTELKKSCPNAVKVLKDLGTQLKKIVQHDPWKTTCPRPTCLPCQSSDLKGRHNQWCIVYESTCRKCKEVEITTSSRSLAEWRGDHIKDVRSRDPEPMSLLTKLSTHKSAFSRQLGEAVSIMTFKGGHLWIENSQENKWYYPH